GGARAGVRPGGRRGGRPPLWQQRQRSAQLLSVAAQFGTFPIVLETVRECLQDVFDVPGLTGLLRDLAARRVGRVEVGPPVRFPLGAWWCSASWARSCTRATRPWP